ncbi:MAG: hypothetical protein RLZZ595_1167 [Bacteroidota bacterium]
MDNKIATVIGASGLIGGLLLEQLINDSEFTLINVLSRRPINTGSNKVKNILLDFNDTSEIKKAAENSAVVFCAIGTTQKKVNGDMTAYKKVDLDLPIRIAQIVSDLNIPKFMLVSSVGADSKSNNFYLKIKGEVEAFTKQLPIQQVGFFQPSLLLGNRKEFRFGEKIAQLVMPLFNFLIPGKYKAIEATVVAKAMLGFAKADQKGHYTFQYTQMKDLASTID